MIQKLDGWPAQVRRKPIRRLYLRLDPDSDMLNISAPEGAPLEVIEAFVRRNRPWIEQKMKKRKEFRLWGENCPPCSQEELLSLYERQMRIRLPERILYWEQMTGLSPAAYVLKNMKSRWGSCNQEKRRICLNIQLAAYPPECLDYVIVHELCHLKVPDHSVLFWREVERYIPGWRQIREQLK